MRTVREELAVRGRYHLAEPAPTFHPTWYQLFFVWVGDRFNDFIGWLAAHVHVGREGSGIAGTVVLIVSVAIVAFAGARLLMALQVSRDRRLATGASFSPPQRSARALFGAAIRSADAGDYEAAVRLLFAAAVTLLDLRGLIHDDDGATINELRRTLRARDAGAERPFATIARAYVSAAYAESRIGPEDWTAAHDAYTALAGRDLA